MTTADAIVLIAYLAGMLALGIFYMRRNTSLKQMFAAGHQSPWWVAGLSGFMTMFSAGTFVVWGGLAYRSGLVAVAVNMAYGVAALLAGAFLAARWRRLGVESPADYVRLRFGASAVQLYLWVMMLFRLIGSGIALYALSVLLCVLVPLDPGNPLRDPATGNLAVIYAVIAFGAVIVLYTMLGGLWAVLMTDVMQFIVLNLAVLITVILILARLGGLEGFAERVPQGFFALTNDDYGWWFIAAWTVIHFFMIGAEWAFVQRFISVPTPRDARRSAWLFGGLYLISPAFWLLPPMLYRAIDPNANPEQAYMLAAQAVLPAGMLGLVLAAMFSATASLISGQLNVFAGALTPMLTRGRDGPAEVRTGRIVTIGLGAFLTLVAALIPLLGGAEKVIVAATSLLVVPLVAPSVWGFFSDRVDQRSAWLTVIAAGGVGLFLRYLITPAGPLGDVAAFQPLQLWAADAGILIDVIVGVAVPMLVLGGFHLLSRRIAPGVARIAALPPAAESAGGSGASDAPRIVALTVGASGALLWMTAIAASADDRAILLVTGAALVALAALSEWIGRRAMRAGRQAEAMA